MDKYCERKSKSGIQIPKQDCLLIGITSLFIACKYNELEFLSIVDIQDKIGKNKYSVLEIKNMETDILQTISFLIPSQTLLDVAFYTYKKY